MTSEQIRYRSDILNTQVITRDTGKRLGVVKELLVDIDRREVVALGLRDNLLSIAGMPRYMLLTSISQMGDVILVEDESAVEDLDAELYSTLISSEVITETGELLGKVRGFKFNSEDGRVSSLIIDSLGYPLIPDRVISTYELPIDEIVSSGPNRLIVFEGAEERLNQLTVGFLENLGIGKAPWEREEEETYFPPTARVENQLGSGEKLRPPIQPSIRPAPPIQNTWEEEEEWEEPAPEPVRRRQQESIYYEEAEEDNWSEASSNRGQRTPYQPPAPYAQDEYDDEYDDEYEEEEEDAWADAAAPKYQAPKVNIPEKTKTPEYEEERGY